jgi:hypothetical protein
MGRRANCAVGREQGTHTAHNACSMRELWWRRESGCCSVLKEITQSGTYALYTYWRFDRCRQLRYDGAHECQADDTATGHNTAAASTSALIQLPYAVHMKPLQSLQKSRHAHAWTQIDHNRTASVMYSDPSVSRIGGIAVTPTSLHFMPRNKVKTVVLLLSYWKFL